MLEAMQEQRQRSAMSSNILSVNTNRWQEIGSRYRSRQNCRQHKNRKSGNPQKSLMVRLQAVQQQLDGQRKQYIHFTRESQR